MSKEFEKWYEETYGETVESAEYGHDMGNYNGPPHPFAIRAAESRGIAKGRGQARSLLEPLLVRERTWRLEDECGGPEVAESISTLKAEITAVLSASQPQEIAGEGCVWVANRMEGFYTVACLKTERQTAWSMNPHVSGDACPHCSKPIVIGGER